VFTAKVSPTAPNEFAIGASATDQATKFIAVVSSYDDTAVASATYTGAAGVVTVTAAARGTSGNAFTLAKTGTAATVSGATLSGGTSGKMRVDVPTGIGIDLLAISKKLVLHPKQLAATDESEDFIIPKAATSGALQFAYKLENERIYNVTFMGYPDPVTDRLFFVGDESAT
jgi:hypothetical protein